MQVRLKILQGSNVGNEIKVPVPKCLIGRGDECNLRPQSDAISRRHCVIISTDHEVAVRDLNSRNGTYVNGERIAEDTVLLTGDLLKVGPLEFELIVEQTAAKIKRTKVTDVKEAAARTAEGSSVSATTELGDVGQWLEEAEETEKKRRPDAETRLFQLDDTTPGGQNAPGEVPGDATQASAETKAIPPEASKKKEGPGKLPPRPQTQSKDSREAAADMLKKFFNRR